MPSVKAAPSFSAPTFSAPSFSVIVTAKDTAQRWSVSPLAAAPVASGRTPDILIDPSITYQTILGFGGALTEAAAYTLSRMSAAKRDEAIAATFDPETGLGYTLGRLHIHSCDFALGNYTYVEDGDESLESFDIARDRRWVLPLIQDAAKVAGQPLTLLASPWSPPAWMKSNGEMNHGGTLLPQYRDTWARYFAKFIRAYRAEGISVWGVTVQNEPEAVQTWDSCIWTGEEERDFVRDNLGPTLRDAGLDDVKILVWDHNRDRIVERASAVLSDPEAAKYVWGTAFHWYVSEEFENVGKVHALFPDKHLLFSEGCQEGGVHLGSWATGERYARNILNDLNNWNEGFLDWNFVLDETGGPNHVGNLCDAPLIADTTTDTLHYNSSYYYIGQISRYVRPGAVRIGVTSTAETITVSAFRNADGSVVAVLLNETDADVPLTLGLEGEGTELNVPAHGIVTVVSVL